MKKCTGITDVFIDAIAFNSADHIFIGTSTQGVLRSTDDGDDWEAVNNGLAFIHPYWGTPIPNSPKIPQPCSMVV